jgi:P63C domain
MTHKENIPQAEYGSPDRPLRVAGMEIPCYVLDDGRRVLILRGMLHALDMSYGSSSSGAGADRLSLFLSTKSVSPFVSEDLALRTKNPIKIRLPGSGTTAYAYEATILADVCDAVLEARNSEKGLHYQQKHIADRCEILVRGFARVGIIALVDEATGYQEVRSRQALEEILDKFISKELAKWAKRFPDDFYKEMFRLRDWRYMPFSVKRPGVVGRYTRDLVYERLAPAIVEELERINPTDGKGRRKHCHHQWLTEDIGHPRLREHLAAVIALMKASVTWSQFQRAVQRALPKYNTNMLLPGVPFKGEEEDA